MLASILLVTGVIAVKIAAQAYHLTSAFLTRGFTCVETSALELIAIALVAMTCWPMLTTYTSAVCHQESNAPEMKTSTLSAPLAKQYINHRLAMDHVMMMLWLHKRCLSHVTTLTSASLYQGQILAVLASSLSFWASLSTHPVPLGSGVVPMKAKSCVPLRWHTNIHFSVAQGHNCRGFLCRLTALEISFRLVSVELVVEFLLGMSAGVWLKELQL